MGRYLAIHIRLSPPEFPKEVLHALLSHSYFQPVSLAGRGRGWFLSGYALEYFVDCFAVGLPAKSRSIEVATGAGDANQAYLSSIARAVNRGKASSTLSPFEGRDPALPATFLQKRLAASEIDHAHQWFQKHPEATFNLYGTFGLAVSAHAPPAPWEHAFRETAPHGIGPPLLYLRLYAWPGAKQMDVMAYTQSGVWFGEDEEWNGIIAAENAAENLERLASLAAGIADSARGRIVETSLSVNGSSFRKHEAALRAAFAKLPQVCFEEGFSTAPSR